MAYSYRKCSFSCSSQNPNSNHHRSASKTPFQWRFAGRPMLVRYAYRDTEQLAQLYCYPLFTKSTPIIHYLVELVYYSL